jgi:hypothetical protein
VGDENTPSLFETHPAFSPFYITDRSFRGRLGRTLAIANDWKIAAMDGRPQRALGRSLATALHERKYAN